MLKIKQLRQEKNNTQRDIANLTGYRQTLVSKWENNEREPDITTLIRLAEYFNVSIDYLVGREEVKEKNNILESIPESRKHLVNEILSLSDAEARDIENYIKGYKDAKRSSAINFFTGEK